MDLVTPEQMREMDRQTIEEVGLPGLVLMERAALGATDHLLEHFAHRTIERVGFLCGGGNNGGDGIAMARILRHRGVEAQIVLLSSADGILEGGGDAAENLKVARSLDVPVYDLGELETEEVRERLWELPECDVWGDALLGTGLTGEVRGRYVPAIEFLNARHDADTPGHGAGVFAIDIPSGINGATGREMGVAVEADATSTFGGAKTGQALYPGRDHCGELRVVDIGIPDAVCEKVGRDAVWLEETWVATHLTARPPVYHKGASGRVLAVAGSHEKTGACLLLARGALRSGAGLITVGSTGEVVERVAPRVNEVMAVELVPGAHADDSEAIEDRLADFIEDMDVVACGPGLETHDGAEAALRRVLDSAVEHLVLDADALNLLAGPVGLEPLETYTTAGTAVLTPHPGEMARLQACDIGDIMEAPVDQARHLARETGAIVVLKMAATVIAAPDGRLAINRSGNPGMATGGTGDVLTGVAAARLADSTGDPFDDMCLAVWAHGAAGDRAAEDLGQLGMGAGDLAERLPEVWRSLGA